MLEILLAVIFIGVLLFYLQRHAPNLLKLLRSGNISGIDDYLMKYGAEGKYILVLLQVVETVSIVLPAVPVYICSGILFGKAQGVLVCYLTNLVLNLIIFLAARRLHISAGNSCSLEKQKYIGKLLTRSKHLGRVVIGMCLLPVVPNGMIPYLAAQTRIGAGEFMRSLAVGSLPAIAVYVCCGDILISDSWRIMLPVIAVLVVLTLVCFLCRKRIVPALEPKVKAFLLD